MDNTRIIIFVTIIQLTFCILDARIAPHIYTYNRLRSDIMDTEKLTATGGRLVLSPRERKANDILMRIKNQEIAEGLKNPEMYPPGMHFFKAKPLIRQSEIFRIIQKMPKGSFLHGHNTGMVSSKWIIKNLTYQFNAMTCKDERGVLLFTLRNNTNCVTPLSNVCIERLRSPDVKQYDRQLERNINLYTMDPEAQISTPYKIWSKFEQMFDTIGDFVKHVAVFRSYHLRMLEELYEDNIQYAEIRAPLSKLYGTTKEYTTLDVAEEFEKIVQEFKSNHPDFLGMKIIYAKRNKATKEEMADQVKEFRELYANKPNFVIGFDLIGNEDFGDPLNKYVDEFSQLPTNANYFFHAGETKWYGKTDWNLLDAILMNTRRIGHGYALPKHPQLWETVKNRGIGLEINPISNQVLGLIWDLRNHPASYFIAENLPVVISADDPGFWNSKGLSYDFYYAFMSLSSADADLRTLKQLALNSIQYSVLTGSERRELKEIFKKKWHDFLDVIIDYRF